MGWTLPLKLAEELVWVAEQFHIPPNVWLDQEMQVRDAMIKFVKLRGLARETRAGRRAPVDLTDDVLSAQERAFDLNDL